LERLVRSAECQDGFPVGHGFYDRKANPAGLEIDIGNVEKLGFGLFIVYRPEIVYVIKFRKVWFQRSVADDDESVGVRDQPRNGFQ